MKKGNLLNVSSKCVSAASNNSNKKDWIWCKTHSYRYGQYPRDVIQGQAFLFLSLSPGILACFSDQKIEMWLLFLQQTPQKNKGYEAKYFSHKMFPVIFIKEHRIELSLVSFAMTLPYYYPWLQFNWRERESQNSSIIPWV